MPNMSNAMENQLLDFIFRAQAYTPPTGLYIALFTTVPTDADPGTEPTAASYKRAGIPCTATDWSATDSPTATNTPSAGTTGVTFNLTAIQFPDPQEDWGAVAHVGVFDALTGGNYLFWGELLYPRDFVAGDVNIQFLPGEISFQIDN